MLLVTLHSTLKVLNTNGELLHKCEALQRKQRTSSLPVVVTNFNHLPKSSLAFLNLFLVSGLSALPGLVPTISTSWRKDVMGFLGVFNLCTAAGREFDDNAHGTLRPSGHWRSGFSNI